MPRPRREDFPGAWHHVMNRGAARTVIYVDDLDREAFLAEVDGAFPPANVELHAFCLMSNHYHLLVRSGEGGLSGSMQRLSSRYTHRFNRRHGRDGPLFRGRFLSIGIADDAHLLQALRYIHLNPVAAGFERRAEDWRWSSAWDYLMRSGGAASRGRNHRSAPICATSLQTSELLAMFDMSPISGYLEFMLEGIDEATQGFYRSLRSGNEPWT